MTKGQASAVGIDRGWSAIGHLLAADEPPQAASAVVDWLREQPGVEAAGVALLSATRVTHRVCRGQDASQTDALSRKLAESARQGSRDTVRVDLQPAGDEGASPRWVEIHPLLSADRTLGVWGVVCQGDGADGGEREMVARWVTEALTTKLESMNRLVRLQKELAQSKRWFNTLDIQLRVLDRERQKLSAVVNQSDTLMLALDGDLVVRWANAAMAARLREAAVPDPMGVDLQVVWTALGADLPAPSSTECPAARAFREGEAVHAELAALGAGQVRNLYLTFLPIRTPRGETAELLVMIQDLSDLEMLRRSETRYRLLFERSPNAMVMAEPLTGCIVLANDVAAQLTGYSPAELDGLSLQEIHDPSDWPDAVGGYAAVMKSDQTLCAERRLRTRHGEQLTAEITAMRFDLDGRFVTFIEFRDVTERRRLQQELHHSQKMEAVGQLAGGVAHDFNNILTVLLGEAELLESMPDVPEFARETAQTIGREARRASLLTRKLLSISRKEIATIEVLDLNEVLQGVEDLLRPLIGDNVGLHLGLCSEPCPVRADRAQLEQVVVNLAVNARDAMPTGGRLRIETEHVEWATATEGAPQDSAQQAVGLTVRDDGSGMDAPTSERLFEPFFTTKPPGAGTGLGLTTVHRIIREHGGTIDVESQPGEGTRFCIRLPLAAGDIVPLRSSDLPTGSRKQERILLVEDRSELRRTTARVLRRAGYDVVSAESGESGLSIATSSEAPFDLLVADVVLPNMSGGELAAAVTTARPEVLVLYISGYAEDDLARHGVSTSQAAFLAKPFSPNALLHAVRKLLDARD